MAPSASDQKHKNAHSVHDYVAELALIEAEISRLEARRLELKSLIDNHKVLSTSTSPSPQPRSLPEDVWAEIFLHCIPVDPPPSPNKAEPPLLFTTISRSWREIALNTPHLWRSMTILLPPLPGTHLFAPVKECYRRMVNQRISGIRSWLDRSGSLLPLTLAIRDLPICGEMDPRHPAHAHCETFRDYMGIVFSYAGRLSRVKIDSRSLHSYQISPYGIGCDSSSTQLTLLGDLEMSFGYWDRVTDLHRKLIACSSLRTLKLGFTSRILGGLPVHWRSLLRLELRPRDRFNLVSWSEILPILAQCCRLQSLITGVGPGRSGDVSDLSRIITSLQTPIHLPDLCSLSLDVDIGDGEAARLALNTLLMPSLIELSIRCVGRIWLRRETPDMPIEHHIISDLIARSNARPVSLCLRLPIPGISIIDLLGSIPTLAHLELEEMREYRDFGADLFTISEALLGALSPNLSPLSPPSVCPNLEHLSLTFFRWKRHTRTIISSFARTWKTAIASGDPELGRLKSVTVKWADIQPVRQPIDNILDKDPDLLLDWTPVWNYVERDRGILWRL
ncbi:hypothetical protein V5O48_008730 [Marasmius crinis-equi]|uniref:F-box domain-containing protein n=1 Tax=Marasmius crinis-equi TaxID=585013 RepID=A0ABR3FD43_9AGAR